MVIFQDALAQRSDDDDLATLFFELANASTLHYRIADDKSVSIAQDLSNTSHTGGCVWETSFLLLTYLRRYFVEPARDNTRIRSPQLGRILEVGAGCGLLGIALAALGEDVVLTEAPAVMANLHRNVYGNQGKARCCQLDWTQYRHDVLASSSLLTPHSFDTIVGTDVLFATHLVEPLVQTIHYMSTPETGIIYICVQVRCADSHALFLKLAKKHWEVQDISDNYLDVAPWGKELECFLFRMMRKIK